MKYIYIILIITAIIIITIILITAYLAYYYKIKIIKKDKLLVEKNKKIQNLIDKFNNLNEEDHKLDLDIDQYLE